MSQRLLRKNNMIVNVPLLKGAEGNEDDEDDEDDDVEDDANTSGDGDDGDNQDVDDNDEGTVSKSEYNKLYRRMQEADRAKTKAVNKAKEYEDKDKTELERATNDIDDLRSENDELKKSLQNVRIENAFFTSNTYKWKNPATALKLLDLSEVEINDDGKVNGMDQALKSLAKSDPYLLNSETDDEDKNRDPSGVNTNTRRKNNKKTSSREELQKKYPALRR